MIVEIEIDNDKSRSMLFTPAGEKVRGRLDFARLREKEAFDLMERFPQGIPGQVIGFDPESNEAYLRDRLDEPEWAAVKAKLEKQGQTSSPRRELTGHCRHAPTMLYWLKRAVDAGLAKVIRGKLPEVVEGEPVKDFNRTVEPEKQGSDTQPLKALVALMFARLPAKEKAEFREAMDAIS